MDNSGSYGLDWNSSNSLLQQDQPRRDLAGTEGIKNQNNLYNLIGTTDLFAVSGTVANNKNAFAQTIITPQQFTRFNFSENMNMGAPFVAIYEGTAPIRSMQIFPVVGTAITANKFICQAGFDWQTSFGTTAPIISSKSVYTVTVFNNNAGTTANLYFVSQWKYTANNGGTSNINGTITN